MWREYFGFVAPALAVLNGLIAIVIALLSIRRSVLKLRLGVTALVFGIIAVGASYYAKHAARIQADGLKALLRKVRDGKVWTDAEILGPLMQAPCGPLRRDMLTIEMEKP